MFKYIIIIIYEVPTPGRAGKKNDAKNKKSCRKQKVVPKKKSRAKQKIVPKKKKSCRKKRVVPKKTVAPQKNSRAREN